MKKVASIFLIVLTIFSYGTQAMAITDFYIEYSEHASKDCKEYYNVNINGIYYNITIYNSTKYILSNYSKYKDHKGKVFFANVESVYANKKCKILKYPDKITFKNYKLKVNGVSVESYMEGTYRRKYKFSYEEIYIPKYATVVNYYSANLTSLRKIHLSENVEILSGLDGYQKLKVKIDKKNKYIKMKNGAIYSKNDKELRTLVNAKKTYKISKGTKELSIIRSNEVENVVFPNDVKRINDYSEIGYCKNLKTIKFGKNTEKVSSSIKGCNSLKKIDFGNKLKVFDGDIYDNNALECIEFPKTLEKIGKKFIGGCISGEKLSKIILNNEKHAPKIKGYVFSSSNDGLSFYVKNQTVADELLNQFKNIDTGIKNANIYVGDTLVYSNINYSKTN